MSRKTLKIIGIAAANLPVLLAVVVIVCVLASVIGATQKKPEDAPVYDHQADFEKINEALREVDEDYAKGIADAPNRYFLYAEYLIVWSQYPNSSPTFFEGIVDLTYDWEGDDEESMKLVAVTDENELFRRLKRVYSPLDEEIKQEILQTRDRLASLMAGKFIAPLYDPDFMNHIVKEFGDGENGMTIAFDGIENLSARAIDGGGVLESEYDRKLGNYVLLQNSDGYESLYGHLLYRSVKAGDQIAVGTVVGMIGDTGFTDEPSLYFELRKDGTPVNPRPYFTKVR